MPTPCRRSFRTRRNGSTSLGQVEADGSRSVGELQTFRNHGLFLKGSNWRIQAVPILNILPKLPRRSRPFSRLRKKKLHNCCDVFYKIFCDEQCSIEFRLAALVDQI